MSRYLKLSLTVLFLMVIFIGVLFLASSLTDSPEALEFVSKLGYLGVLITAIIAGLNTFVPLPAATLTPIFLSAGLYLPLIIFTLALGTLIADFVGFTLGRVSREMVKDKHPKIFNYFFNLQTNHKHLILPIVLLYAAFAPLPNEIILIPLALAGVKFKKILIPLLVGNLIHQAIFSFGVTSIFGLLG